MQKILIIRFHAIGDIAAALPACNGLRKLLLDAQIDFLTGSDVRELVSAPGIFNNVYTVPISRGGFFSKIKSKLKLAQTARELKKNSYDTIIDLQNNRNSKIILNAVKPQSQAEFDKFSPKAHSTRVLETIQKAGLGELRQQFIRVNDDIKSNAEELLITSGWDKKKKLVVLNPAGLWITRNWQIDNYVKLANLFNANETMFVTLGDERIIAKAKILKSALGENLIDLSGKTTLQEALGVLANCSLVISEDSGLVHMAWALGVPLVLMLGSTRSDWTCHTTGKIICLNSSDLECGNCMQPQCKYGDVHCLTRYTPEFIYRKSLTLLNNKAEQNV